MTLDSNDAGEAYGSATALRAGLRGWSGAAVLAVLVAALFGSYPALDAYFRIDDFGYVAYHWFHSSESLWSFFIDDLLVEQDSWGGDIQYEVRPMEVLAWRIQTLFGSVDPAAYRAFSLCVHAAVSLLVLTIARTFSGASRLGACFAALLFALLPVHDETFLWASARADLVSACFALICFLGYAAALEEQEARRRRWMAISLASFMLALFTKEATVTVIALLPAWDLIVGGRDCSEGEGGTTRAAIGRRVLGATLRCSPFAAGLVAFLAIRATVLPSFLIPVELTFLEGIIELCSRQAYYLSALVHAGLAQGVLSAYGALYANSSSAIFIWFGAIILASAVGLGAWASFGPRRPAKCWRLLIFFGPVWWVLTGLPMAATYVSERHLYMPSVGVCIALSGLLLFGAKDAARGPLRKIAVYTAMLAVLIAAEFGLYQRSVVDFQRADEFRELHEAALAEAERLPYGSRLLIAPKLKRDGRWVANWTMPFALQQPFASQDLYQKLDILEVPEAYCCPKKQWWEARGEKFQKWLGDDLNETILIGWSQSQDKLIVRPVTHSEVQTRFDRIRRAKGRRADSGKSIRMREAIELMESFTAPGFEP